MAHTRTVFVIYSSSSVSYICFNGIQFYFTRFYKVTCNLKKSNFTLDVRNWTAITKGLSVNKAASILLLVLMLNVLMVNSTPTHRVRRHRHLRGDQESYPRCQQEMTDQGGQACGRHRARRHLDTRYNRNGIHLSDGQTISLCPYSVCEDENPERNPRTIHRVICQHSGCRCHNGSFHCTQLWNQVDVMWSGSAGDRKNQTIEVEFGCVCAAKYAVTVEPSRPDTMD